MHQPPAESNSNLSSTSNKLFASSPRRGFLRTAGLLAAAGTGALALPSIARAGPPVGTGLFARRTIPNVTPGVPFTPLTDESILNFALNLEYLEAEYYSWAVNGQGLDGFDTDGSGPLGNVTVKPGAAVPFVTPAIRQYAEEIAADELAHVRFLRDVLSNRRVARPAINLRESFNTMAQLAGLGSNFDPFTDEDSFLIGAFIFEDVGVTAYAGALRNINNRDFIQATGGLLGAEAYHAGNVRTLLFSRGLTTPALAISNARDTLDGSTNRDQGIVDSNGSANIVPTDDSGLVFSRTTSQVLNIVYLNPNGIPGGFFPSGMNGIIR